MAVAFDCGIPGSPMEGVGLLGRVALVGRAVQDERRDRGRRVRRRVGRAAGGRLFGGGPTSGHSQTSSLMALRAKASELQPASSTAGTDELTG